MVITANQVIEKRKELWEQYQDPNKDFEYVLAVANELLENKQLLQEVIDNPELLIEMTFTIVDKNKSTVPFFLNDVQKDFIKLLNESIEKHNKGQLLHLRFLVLKGRQQGFTSVITAYQLANTLIKKNFTGFTLADTADNVRAIFQDKAKYVYNQLPDILKPTEKYNSKTEMFFENLNSSWRINVATAQVGRSRTINFFHGSEAAFWTCLISDTQSSLGEALTKDSIQILESTANGFNEFKDLWDNGEWINCFYEWWRTKEYQDSFESQDIKNKFLYNIDHKQEQEWIWERLNWLKYKTKLKDEQLYWYYNKYKNYLNKDLIKQEYPCTPEEAFLNSGNCVFNIELLMQRKVELQQLYKEKPYKRGFFKFKWNDAEAKDYILNSTIEFVESHMGMIKIYEDPKAHGFYVLGGDTAGDGSDFFAGTMIDNTTGKRVATLHAKVDADIYTWQMYCLGMYYNQALASIEINFNTFPVIELKRLKYPHQYIREEYDSISKKMQEKFGWKTDRNTRPLIISEEQSIVKDHIELFTDIETIEEMLTFIYDEDLRPDATEGKHDDLLFSDMIAQATRWQQNVERQPARVLEGFFTPTELEDEGYINNTTPIRQAQNRPLRSRRRG